MKKTGYGLLFFLLLECRRDHTAAFTVFEQSRGDLLRRLGPPNESRSTQIGLIPVFAPCPLAA